MMRRLAVAALVGVVATASATYCPPLTELKDDWPLSRILKDVCKREQCSDNSCVNCQDVPPLIDLLAQTATEVDMAKNFELAGQAAEFMCGKCLDPVRQPIIYLTDSTPDKPELTGDASIAAACPADCMEQFHRIADSFGGKALEYFSQIEEQCSSSAPNPRMVKDAMEGMMMSIESSLESVRQLASSHMSMFEKAEPNALPAREPVAAPLFSQHNLRVASYACLAVGTVLLAAAFALRSPAADEQALL